MLIGLEIVLGAVLGLALVGGVFYFAFREMPKPRSDGELTQHEPTYWMSGDDGGGHT